MKIATLSIGDEVIFGEIADTNASFIAARLYDIGLKVRHHLAVGDVEGDIVEAIRTLAATCEAVIATGGLGPTIDDITARAAAKATDRRLVLNETALAHLKEFLAKRGRALDSANEKQALLPAKSSLIANPSGTACGFHFQHNGCSFFFLPGVPKEMERMVEESIIPLLRERRKQGKTIRVKVLKVFGVPEAQLDTMLKGVTESDSPVTVAFQVDFPQILVKLRAEGDSEMHTIAALDEVCRKSREILHGHLFAEDNETMDSVVAALFREKGLTVSLAESCSGGLVAKRITDTPGCSAYFLEGAVTYSNAAKMRNLAVSLQLLEEMGSVSSEVAMAMARGMRKLSGSDIALAVTGVAGPDGGTSEKPVGTVFIALAAHDRCHAKRYQFTGNRAEIRDISSFMALDWLRRYLLLGGISVYANGRCPFPETPCSGE
jgi:nicotinamide-nucleotide amidase